MTLSMTFLQTACTIPLHLAQFEESSSSAGTEA